jgi:hypothetical protein
MKHANCLEGRGSLLQALIVYLGAAGAIADYRIGDVVIPKEFTDRHYHTVPFEQNGAADYQSELAQLVDVYAGKKQGWVQAIFD